MLCNRAVHNRKNKNNMDESHLGAEPKTPGSPTSPIPEASVEFLPEFLMGNLSPPVTPEPHALSGPPVSATEMMSPLLAGVSPQQPVDPTPKRKSSAPPVQSLYDELASVGFESFPLSSGRPPASFFLRGNPFIETMPSTPGTASGTFSPASAGQPRTTPSPAQLGRFYATLTAENQLDGTWVTVFGFTQASASYILLQFAQHGNILKHVMSNTGNWMHIRYQSKLQAQKALSKDGKIFGGCIMIGVKPCTDKSVMENLERSSGSSVSSVFTPRFPTMRPLAAAYRASTRDYQVVSERQPPRKDETILSKAMGYLFRW
ncbi:nucleoporin NUP35-like [Pluvialis apricaria]